MRLLVSYVVIVYKYRRKMVLMRDAETTPHIAIMFFFIIHFIHNYFCLHTSFHIIENSISLY